jgi:hypothetical protein
MASPSQPVSAPNGSQYKGGRCLVLTTVRSIPCEFKKAFLHHLLLNQAIQYPDLFRSLLLQSIEEILLASPNLQRYTLYHIRLRPLP